jgi:hypothetical protein
MLGVVYDPSTDHGHHRFNVLNLACRNREVVPVENNQVCKLAALYGTGIILLENEIGIAARVGNRAGAIVLRTLSRLQRYPRFGFPLDFIEHFMFLCAHSSEPFNGCVQK